MRGGADSTLARAATPLGCRRHEDEFAPGTLRFGDEAVDTGRGVSRPDRQSSSGTARRAPRLPSIVVSRLRTQLGTNLDLLFATDGVLLRGRDRDRRELARLDYSEIDKMELGEVSQPTSGKRRAGETGLGVSLGVLSGVLFGDSKRGWSTAGELLESHTVDVTLITSRGRITLLHESPDKLEEVRGRLAPGLERIKAAGPG